MVAPAALVSACAGYQVDQTASTSPTVSYAYYTEADYDLVAKRADLYCEDNYGRDAVLIDRDRQGNGYEATFGCR
ncbi:hypothetical protein [Thalassobaculum sp.]|uniref:hypothetical protein n=1 Tax=Thalassobaculum sp. TaxID=2022740 RepID=UPI0032ECA93E